MGEAILWLDPCGACRRDPAFGAVHQGCDKCRREYAESGSKQLALKRNADGSYGTPTPEAP